MRESVEGVVHAAAMMRVEGSHGGEGVVHGARERGR